jgi:LysR family nitrogen assimilation transcriptional regulator
MVCSSEATSSHPVYSKPAMDTKQLRFLTRIIELGSLSRAAEDLAITQSALSYQIIRLEEELRVPLLNRHSRGVTATTAGRAILARAYAIQKEMESIRTDVQATARDPIGEITFAAPASVAINLGPILFKRLGQTYPDIRLAIREGVPLVIHDLLTHGKADFVVIFGIELSGDIEATPLIRDKLHIVGSSALPPLPEHGIDLPDLDGLPVIVPSSWYGIRREIEQLMHDGGHRLNILAEVDSIGVTKQLVRQGFAYAVLPKFATFPELRDNMLWATPINGAALQDTLKLARLRHRMLSPAGRAFQTMILEEVRSLTVHGWGMPPAE